MSRSVRGVTAPTPSRPGGAYGTEPGRPCRLPLPPAPPHMRAHRWRFDRTPAMPLIPFDISHGDRPTDPGKFSNRFSDGHPGTRRQPETRYASST